MDDTRRILKKISVDYYREMKRYWAEWIDYNVPLVPDVNPFRKSLQLKYFEMNVCRHERGQVEDVNYSFFNRTGLWFPFRYLKRATGSWWEKYAPNFSEVPSPYEWGMWTLERRIQGEFVGVCTASLHHLLPSEKSLEKRREKRAEHHWWFVRVGGILMLEMCPPTVRSFYDWYTFLFEPGLFTFLRAYLDVHPKPKLTVLQEALGTKRVSHSQGIVGSLQQSFEGSMGYLLKQSETRPITWRGYVGELLACIPAGLLTFPFALRFKCQLAGISFEEAMELGLMWGSLPVYLLRVTLTRAATLLILEFVPLRKLERQVIDGHRKMSNSVQNRSKTRRKKLHSLVFKSILCHWLSRIVDVLAKALVYPLWTVENRTATSVGSFGGIKSRRFTGGVHCASEMVQEEGPSSFYNGFWALLGLAVFETAFSWAFLYPVATAAVNVCSSKEEED